MKKKAQGRGSLTSNSEFCKGSEFLNDNAWTAPDLFGAGPGVMGKVVVEMVGLSTLLVVLLEFCFGGGLNFNTPCAVSLANSSGVNTSGFPTDVKTIHYRHAFKSTLEQFNITWSYYYLCNLLRRVLVIFQFHWIPGCGIEDFGMRVVGLGWIITLLLPTLGIGTFEPAVPFWKIDE